MLSLPCYFLSWDMGFIEVDGRVYRFYKLSSAIQQLIIKFTDLVAPITDPEHPFSLASLGVVKLEDIHLVSPPDPTKAAALSHLLVELTPTVTHCSLATVIGLCVRVRLDQALPPSFRVEVKIKSGTHNQSDEVNKQLADKERVAAALENAQLMGVLRNMMKTCLEP